jgi:hypothetical protein
MQTRLIFLVSFLIVAGVAPAQNRLPVFDAAVIEKEDPREIEEWGVGCSFYCAVFSVKTQASSSLPHRNRLKYDAEQAHDFNLNTAWVEGKEGDGIGESLVYTIAGLESELKITSLTIFNGYRKSRELWEDNSRVKQFRIHVDGKPYGLINLKDAYDYQTVEIGQIQLKPGKTTTLKFEILAVYKGRKFADTAISEIELEGCCAH